MNNKQFVFTLTVAIISGFLGGTLGVWFLMPPSVLAQGEPQKVIVAEEFAVVDQKGTLRALLGTSDGRASLLLYDARPEPPAPVHDGGGSRHKLDGRDADLLPHADGTDGDSRPSLRRLGQAAALARKLNPGGSAKPEVPEIPVQALVSQPHPQLDDSHITGVLQNLPDVQQRKGLVVSDGMPGQGDLAHLAIDVFFRMG